MFRVGPGGSPLLPSQSLPLAVLFNSHCPCGWGGQEQHCSLSCLPWVLARVMLYEQLCAGRKCLCLWNISRRFLKGGCGASRRLVDLRPGVTSSQLPLPALPVLFASGHPSQTSCCQCQVEPRWSATGRPVWLEIRPASHCAVWEENLTCLRL